MASKFLSHQGYSIIKSTLTDEELDNVRKELTVAPNVSVDFVGAQPKPFKLFQEGPTKIYVPKFYGLNKFGDPDVMRVEDGEEINVEFKGSLRPEQQAPMNAYMSTVSHEHASGGLLNLTCASGKTVMAIYIICALKRKTMVIVHKDFLLQQWKEHIQQFAPSAKIGMIKAKVVDTADKDIVLASLQSLSMKEYKKDVFDGFGLVVVDEVHHTSAEVFSRALRKVAFKYTLGLSATIRRKDGLSKVFKWYLGDVVYSNVKKKTLDTVHVSCKYYYEPDPSYSQEIHMMGKKLNIAKMINNICEYKPRTDFVVSCIEDALLKEPGRKIIVLSDRRGHLERLGAALKANGHDAGFYFGGMKQEDLKESEGKKILLGTFCMVAEGFDCKALDTLVIASPKSDVVQSVGRILREEAANRRHIPLVIDIIDQFSIFQRQGSKRLKYYKAQKYHIDGVQPVTDNKCVQLESLCLVDIE